MSDLRTVPAIRAEAERRAEAVQAALHRRGMVFEWAGMSRAARDLRVEAHLDLLCDLTRPASRDAVARLVAAKVGIECGATAPAFYPREPYWLLCAGPQVEDGEEWDGELDFGATPSGDWPRRRIPALVGVTDPAEALRLIAIHVLGADHD